MISLRYFQLPPYASFEELVGPEYPELAVELRRLYGDDIEALEFVAGIYLEKRREQGMFGETIIEMGAPASVTGGVCYYLYSILLVCTILSYIFRCVHASL